MINIVDLNAESCSKLRVIRNLPRLQSLNAAECKNLIEVSKISDDYLNLDISGCKKLKEIKCMKKATILIK
jgi:hypothetical protein